MTLNCKYTPKSETKPTCASCAFFAQFVAMLLPTITCVLYISRHVLPTLFISPSKGSWAPIRREFLLLLQATANAGANTSSWCTQEGLTAWGTERTGNRTRDLPPHGPTANLRHQGRIRIDHSNGHNFLNSHSLA